MANIYVMDAHHEVSKHLILEERLSPLVIGSYVSNHNITRKLGKT